ncbi:MAG: heparinase II/III family protein, partial [Candidatus Latescibacteria bacterium]|nr:heparinase II/III family protein [Candidatus Latescibacterota bacterium]
NASISVYDGRYGYNHEKTTTRTTRVATGLWGCSRIATELSTTGLTFLKLFQAYNLVKKHISPKKRRKIEQNFLLELFLDVKAYKPITNKAGPVQAARIAFGLVYNNKTERNAGLSGYHKILESQFYPDGSMKESPIYGHKPIGEDLWKIPEMFRGTKDLYGKGLYRSALQAFADISLPYCGHPPLDDSSHNARVQSRTVDIAAVRCNIHIPYGKQPPSEFLILNTDLGKRPQTPSSSKALNHYYEGRHLACLGFGSGTHRTQLYLLGEDGRRGHRHAGPLTVQLFADEREIFPDLGYICDHPGNQWVKATPSHQTVTVDGNNLYPAEPSTLHGLAIKGSHRFVDMSVPIQGGITLRRALTLIRKPDGLPILIDLFDVCGGHTHDYNTRIVAPPKSLKLSDQKLKTRKTILHQDHSFYPLLDFQTAGKTDGIWTATWGRGTEKTRAHILTPCTELITYRSPGWRNQHEITAHPKQYFDTIVLRNRRKQSRYIVVYEITKGRPHLQKAELNDKGDIVNIQLTFTGQRSMEVTMPGNHTSSSESLWNVQT